MQVLDWHCPCRSNQFPVICYVNTFDMSLYNPRFLNKANRDSVLLSSLVKKLSIGKLAVTSQTTSFVKAIRLCQYCQWHRTYKKSVVSASASTLRWYPSVVSILPQPKAGSPNESFSGLADADQYSQPITRCNFSSGDFKTVAGMSCWSPYENTNIRHGNSVELMNMKCIKFHLYALGSDGVSSVHILK
ncbi:hypothetical protein NQ317_003997 [Molorchus minor]|uniref:Uncharacterized protein n=1 Tax=Molorchus minor TaxID=1323400 RepID=A0ABQ9IZ79_9CUCU|nr:hypothetical protein NQ317_003997 [Molorchus minor]